MPSETGAQVLPHLQTALSATDWRAREEGINAAGIRLIEQLNALNIIENIPAKTEQFHASLHYSASRTIQDSLAGTDCEHLPPFVGGIDVCTDSTDALTKAEFRRTNRTIFSNS